MEFVTHTSEYGTFTYLSKDYMAERVLSQNKHFESWELKRLLPLIPPNKNIIEAGGHVGTHTIPYARCTQRTIYVFEPQKPLYDLLRLNIQQNNITNAVAIHAALSHYTGVINLTDEFPDGSTKGQPIDYESHGNFGGIIIGKSGELVPCFKLDDFSVDTVGFLHLDAQGSEPLIAYGAQNLIKRDKPIIFFENNRWNNLERRIRRAFPELQDLLDFNICEFCKTLGYQDVIKVSRGNWLLLPSKKIML